MDSKVIEFTKIAEKKRKNVKINCFSEIAEMLRGKVELLEFIGDDVDERLQFFAKITGRRREEFTVDIADMLTFWNALVIGDVGILYCFSEEQDHILYRAIFQYDMENEKVGISYEKLQNGKAVAGYDQGELPQTVKVCGFC